MKRKLKGGLYAPRKKVKVASNLEDLPWKTLSRPIETGLSGDDGILELEEVEGVEVVYEETEKGRVTKFKVRTPLHLSDWELDVIRRLSSENQSQKTTKRQRQKKRTRQKRASRVRKKKVVSIVRSLSVLMSWYSRDRQGNPRSRSGAHSP
jgi:ATP-dependent RNA helicase DDX24/MAK5